MTDRPTPFSGPMVHAILDGRKTQTRRVLRLHHDEAEPPFVSHWGFPTWCDPDGSGAVYRYPRSYAHGDRLWVREAWRCKHSCDDVAPRDMSPEMPILWVADGAMSQPGAKCWIAEEQRSTPVAYGRHRVGMHMPRWASRLTLIVTDVRVQRVQEISEDDAKAEGVGSLEVTVPSYGQSLTHREGFARLWDALNARRGYGWDANPWVVAYTFAVHRQNIDQMEAPAI